MKKFKKSLPLAEISAYVVCSRPDLMFSLLQFLQLLTTQTIPKGSCTKNLFPRKLEFQYLKRCRPSTWKHQRILHISDIIRFITLNNATVANSCTNNLKFYNIAAIIFIINNCYFSPCPWPPCKCTNLKRLHVITMHSYLTGKRKGGLTLLWRTEAS